MFCQKLDNPVSVVTAREDPAIHPEDLQLIVSDVSAFVIDLGFISIVE